MHMSLCNNRVYNNAVLSVAALNLSAGDDTTADAYRQIYRDAVAGSPVVSGSGFDLYHNEKEGICVARLELPDYAYAIAAVRTGQFKGEGEKIWEGSFNLAGPSGDGQAAP